MNCENEYCIYNLESKCLLEKISVNSLGMCDDCIMISLDEGFLAAEKQRQLSEIESRWNSDSK